VNRVSTSGNYAIMLANLMRAQQDQSAYGSQLATQKKATDLKGFANTADTLTAMNTVKARLQTYQDQNGVVADRLASQDAALNQITDAAANVREAIANALATGKADTLMEEVKAQLQSAVEGLNARYNGKYLFAGGQVDTKPVTVTQLSDLGGAVPVGGFFQNDDYKLQNKLDDSTTITSGMLASDIGTQLMSAFQALQDSPVGPFNGQLTQAQQTWLQGQLGGWDTVRQDLTTVTASNGMLQQRVDTSKQNLSAQDTTLTGMMGDITDADMGMVSTQLQMAQMSVQAAAHVFQSLQGVSLLSLLPMS
jgi:flagellar hook-associated protein 3 FlgL